MAGAGPDPGQLRDNIRIMATKSGAFLLVLVVAILGLVSGISPSEKRRKACGELGEAIERNMERTKDRGGTVTLGGGRSIPYAKSETRLNDVLKGVCLNAAYPDECNDILSAEDARISEWFFAERRGKFNNVVCDAMKPPGPTSKKTQQQPQQQQEEKGCKCPFAKWWCPCKGKCDGGSQCCCVNWKKCSSDWFGRAKDTTMQYSQKAAQKASEYGKYANEQLDKVPVGALTEKLPLDKHKKRFIRDNWKAILLTLILVIVTPLYYFAYCGPRSPMPTQRSASRLATRRQHSRG